MLRNLPCCQKKLETLKFMLTRYLSYLRKTGLVYIGADPIISYGAIAFINTSTFLLITLVSGDKIAPLAKVINNNVEEPTPSFIKHKLSEIYM